MKIPTLRDNRKLYLLPDTVRRRGDVGEYGDVFQHPRGGLDVRAWGRSLRYSTYDQFATIDPGEIVDDNRPGNILRFAQIVSAASSRAASSAGGLRCSMRAN